LIIEDSPKNKIPGQLDLFGVRANTADETAPASISVHEHAADPLVGLWVRTPDACRCASDVAVIGAGTETHRASLRCRSCGRHRGWLSKFTAGWIENVVGRWGRPEIIKIRGPRL
jgi:hypothetical protein